MVFVKKKENDLQQSIKYISKTLLNLSSENVSRKIFGITSSYDNKEFKYDFCQKIFSEIKTINENSYFIDADFFNGENSKDIKQCKSPNELPAMLQSMFETSGLVILNMPCVLSNADSIDYAKLCDKIFLFERYSYTKYLKYEESILHFKNNSITISGVIAYD